MTRRVPFALYDAFADTLFGGSQAAIVSDAADIPQEFRIRIAKEIGVPATAFVSAASETDITVQFFSTVMELPMCGHGTMGLMTRMVEEGIVPVRQGAAVDVALHLPKGTANVAVEVDENGRPLAMLDVRVPQFRDDGVDVERLCQLLSIPPDALSEDLPIETTVADFIHLMVPMRDLNAIAAIEPDFAGLVQFCHDYGIETIVPISTETTSPDRHIHLRDFCPAVGVAESAAGGTTNAAVASYLFRHGVVRSESGEPIRVCAEQGLELGRPSTIHSVIAVSDDGMIARLQVGGVATKVADGSLLLPDDMS